MSAAVSKHVAVRAGSDVLRQETFAWGGVADIDCITIMQRLPSKAGPCGIFQKRYSVTASAHPEQPFCGMNAVELLLDAGPGGERG